MVSINVAKAEKAFSYSPPTKVGGKSKKYLNRLID